MFGRKQLVSVKLLDTSEYLSELSGVVMELEDLASPCLVAAQCTSSAQDAFTLADVVFVLEFPHLKRGGGKEGRSGEGEEGGKKEEEEEEEVKTKSEEGEREEGGKEEEEVEEEVKTKPEEGEREEGGKEEEEVEEEVKSKPEESGKEEEKGKEEKEREEGGKEEEKEGEKERGESKEGEEEETEGANGKDGEAKENEGNLEEKEQSNGDMKEQEVKVQAVGENESADPDLTTAAALYQRYAALLDFHAQKSVRVIVAGRYGNTGASLMAKFASSLQPGNFVASSSLAEQQARSILAGKLGLNPSKVEQVGIWGLCYGDVAVDTSQTCVHDFPGAVTGPRPFSLPVNRCVFEPQWLSNELPRLLASLHGCSEGSRGGGGGGASEAHGLAEMVTAWCGGGEEEEEGR